MPAWQRALQWLTAPEKPTAVSLVGKSFSPTIGDLGTEGHFGLQGMHERVSRIGGTLTVVSSTGSGTEITVVVPGGIVLREPSASPLDKRRTILRRVGPSTHRK